MLLQDLNAHDRDSHIYMDEPTHVYYLDSIPMSISGTGFLHLFFDPFEPHKVADELSKKAKPDTKYYGKTPEEILAIWSIGTNAGTIMHKNIEYFFNGLITEDRIHDRDDFGLFDMFYILFNKWGLEPYRTEWIIYDKDYDIAGSIDFVAKNKKTGNFWVIDWKRSNKFSRNSFREKKGKRVCDDVEDCNGIHYQLQVNLYQHILEKNYGIKIEQCVLVNLHPDLKQPDLLMAEDMQDKIQQMVNYWTDNKEKLLEEHKKH